MSETLFIADLHLHPKQPDTLALFTAFLKGAARDLEKLYILGDLFEVWLGDDDDEPAYQDIIKQLRRLSEAGTAIKVLQGNRDFLLGQGFSERTGCELLPESSVIDVYGTPTLIMHGDTLCTLDAAYQAFRKQVHNPEWQAQILSQPLAQRRMFAKQARQQSQMHTQGSSETIMDVTPEAVVNALHRYGVMNLIHGHTHRPAIHEIDILGEPARRWVVGDWQESGAIVLHCTPQTHQLKRLNSKGLSQI
ncbi:MAG: UDP-2,3-diacylglucosamine diphosphatase [Thiotrichaceae bacterium]|nr:UDP-2,3-diacylglucosamine diphosphatase [Thiotrichaceae bacterium]